MRRLWVVVLIVCSAGPAQAFTCADVRAMSLERQAHYIRTFNITPAQQQRIRLACYGARSHPAVSILE